MIISYTSVIFKRWHPKNDKIILKKLINNGKILHQHAFKRGFSNIRNHGDIEEQKKCMMNINDNGKITEYIQNEYGISSNLIDLNITRCSDKNNIYELSNIWNKVFKCEKSLYDIINKYIKTNKMDYYLHICLESEKGNDTNGKSVSKADNTDNAIKYNKENNCNISSIDKPMHDIENEIKNVLVYIMAMFYKKIVDFHVISLLSEKLIILLKKLKKNYDNKNLIFTIFDVYNHVKVMNDELFLILFDILNNCYETNPKGNKLIDDNKEMVLILKTLYNQKYKNHNIVDKIIESVKKKNNLDKDLLVNSLFYLALLSKMDYLLLNKMNDELYEVLNVGEIDENNMCSDQNIEKIPPEVKIKLDLTSVDCTKLIYSYFILGEDYINWFVIYKLLLKLCDDLKNEGDINLLLNRAKEYKNMHADICIIRSYLRYKKRNFYDSLPKYVKKILKNIYILDVGEKKVKERKFNEKVSWHLKKLRIPHIKNVYKSGIIFDILEKDKRLVWLCFSYHHYYVKTIDLTSEKLLQLDIIKSMNYKIAKMHYYQFSRMKARRTRFEYIRMNRYYSLRDRRNFDDQFEGWSLPYINWYHKKNKNVHISNYFYNYTPVSEMQY
ncbi:conserved Plasmodium protein, unknown function [Plasmodium vinckei vinckei]|uniref:RAP domain-containing protein n=1 Tax=Plasmodium vinckei vinckei TaxID=54757 RepID=A0A449BSK3_PLAVN|nr:conserved Plasmodium protein, unknown function [Plasmodium vinckei vinckei]KEG02079.1 hypothetical protein YYE_02818 [Plasmodium vinckei vinckei]VEV56319.1 conserved Plasmodium protein, unknown function [Plasmodium vinckei vinckei]